MVYVRLQRDWTDDDGTRHAAGETVDVDVSTLAQLETAGVVSDPTVSDASDGDDDHGGSDDSGDNGGDGSGDSGDVHSWVGPTDGDPQR